MVIAGSLDVLISEAILASRKDTRRSSEEFCWSNVEGNLQFYWPILPIMFWNEELHKAEGLFFFFSVFQHIYSCWLFKASAFKCLILIRCWAWTHMIHSRSGFESNSPHTLGANCCYLLMAPVEFPEVRKWTDRPPANQNITNDNVTIKMTFSKSVHGFKRQMFIHGRQWNVVIGP